MMAALLAAVAVIVGFFTGAVGPGGILLIPSFVILGGLEIHQATATTLFVFLFTGVLGTWLFYRKGHVHWRVTLPICAGSVAFSYLGALVNSKVDSQSLTIIIAAIIVFSGAYLLLPSRHAEGSYRDGRGAAQQALLLCVGAVSGFGSGLSGAGGAVFCVPLMLIAGFIPIAAIGTSQVLQIVVAASGTLGNLQHGTVDFMAAAWVALFACGGVVVGARTAHTVNALTQRRMVAALCVVVGTFMLARAL
jgi:uncharacterized membrane protein YfcA